MVTLISRHMYGKKSLIGGFNGTDFDDDFNFILNDVYHNYKEIIINKLETISLMPAYQRTSKLTTGGWTQKNQFITESVVV